MLIITDTLNIYKDAMVFFYPHSVEVRDMWESLNLPDEMR